MDIILHPRSEKKVAALSEQLPHALLLSGEPGVGLASIAKHIAGENIAAFIEPHDNKDDINHETGTISIETIRRLYDQTRAKHVKKQVVIIDDADRMSLGAQAAFLKLLEEPSSQTHFILTSHSPQRLLATIRSRVQTITIEPLTAIQTKTFIDKLGISDAKTRAQLEFLASGRPAELARLTSDNAYFKRRAETAADTRTFLTGSTYQKLLIVHKYHKNKSEALELLDSALAVTRRTLTAKPQVAAISQLERLLQTREKIEANCNARLQLTAFVVQ